MIVVRVVSLDFVAGFYVCGEKGGGRTEGEFRVSRVSYRYESLLLIIRRFLLAVCLDKCVSFRSLFLVPNNKILTGSALQKQRIPDKLIRKKSIPQKQLERIVDSEGQRVRVVRL